MTAEGVEPVDAPLPAPDLAARLQEFEQFRASVIQADLERLRQRQQRLQEDIKEYDDLLANVAKLIQEQQRTLDTRVDLGCGVRVAAHVPDTSRLLVAVGLGFHVEVPLAEVEQLVAPRREHLKAELVECEEKLGAVAAHADAFDDTMRRLREGEPEARQGAGV